MAAGRILISNPSPAAKENRSISSEMACFSLFLRVFPAAFDGDLSERTAEKYLTFPAETAIMISGNSGFSGFLTGLECPEAVCFPISDPAHFGLTGVVD